MMQVVNATMMQVANEMKQVANDDDASGDWDEAGRLGNEGTGHGPVNS